MATHIHKDDYKENLILKQSFSLISFITKKKIIEIQNIKSEKWLLSIKYYWILILFIYLYILNQELKMAIFI